MNKISGFYGILAIFTGYHLSGLQLSMYIYSILALLLTVYLAPGIRRQDPFKCLAFAWMYALDSIVNALYTAAFGVAWFLVLGSQAGSAGKAKVPGAGMIDDTAGFTNPQHNVSHVDIQPTPAPGAAVGEDAVAVGQGYGNAQGLGDAVFQSGSVTSITIISGLWLLRVYFILVVLSYARAVLRQYIAYSSQQNYELHKSTATDGYAENPFAEGREQGQGWRGKLGRIMVSVSRGYWLGPEANGSADWARGLQGRFNRGSKAEEPIALQERERRRRSGTGPPEPPNMPAFVKA